MILFGLHIWFYGICKCLLIGCKCSSICIVNNSLGCFFFISWEIFWFSLGQSSISSYVLFHVFCLFFSLFGIFIVKFLCFGSLIFGSLICILLSVCLLFLFHFSNILISLRVYSTNFIRTQWSKAINKILLIFGVLFDCMFQGMLTFIKSFFVCSIDHCLSCLFFISWEILWFSLSQGLFLGWSTHFLNICSLCFSFCLMSFISSLSFFENSSSFFVSNSLKSLCFSLIFLFSFSENLCMCWLNLLWSQISNTVNMILFGLNIRFYSIR